MNKEKLLSGNIVARKYRNRRMGDFLKELRLTEGRGTGIPKIKRAMSRNGSPKPIFDTDEDLAYFLTVLPIHANWEKVQDGVQDGLGVEVVILSHCMRPKKRREILAYLGLFDNYKNFERYIKPLVAQGYLDLTIPNRPTSGNQQYKTTHKGEEYLKQAK